MITGKNRPRLIKLINKNSLTDNVLITGFIPYDLFPLYMSASDIFLLPYPDTLYNWGRWPSKISDYLAIGRPIITNPVGDIRNLFTN